MENNDFEKKFRIAKIVQFSLLFLIEVILFLILLCNPVLARELLGVPLLCIFCILIWLLTIVQLGGLIYDILMLRSFAKERNSLKKVAYLDSLTGIPNRHGMDLIFHTYDSSASLENTGCCLLTIENLEEINDTLGREMGDLMIKQFSSMLEATGDSIGVVGRNSGNDFLFLSEHSSADSMEYFLHSLNRAITQHNKIHPKVPIRIKSAYVLNSELHFTNVVQMLNAAYKKLYRNN